MANIVRRKKKKQKKKKQPWITAELLDLCDKKARTEKEKIRTWTIWEIQGSEQQHQEVHKKAKESWIEEQRTKIEENPRKHNSKRAYQLVKDLTTVKQGKATTVQDRSGKCLTEERQILNRWTEYCSELYNHKAIGDPSVLKCSQTDTKNDHPILFKEVEDPVQSLKKGKSAGVNNIPAELVQACGEDVITALTTICTKIWQTGEWQTPWIQSLVIILPKIGNLQQCQNYRTISPISRPSKVTVNVILNRLKPQAEKIIAEEQAGFTAGMSTTEQIFNLRILCEKYLQHQQDL